MADWPRHRRRTLRAQLCAQRSQTWPAGEATAHNGRQAIATREYTQVTGDFFLLLGSDGIAAPVDLSPRARTAARSARADHDHWPDLRDVRDGQRPIVGRVA
jgi:hypothetical protein